MAAVARRLRVLLVSADPAVLHAVDAALGRPGLRYLLRSSASPEGLLSSLRSEFPDVVLIAVPGAHDFPAREIFNTIRKVNPGLPVVVLGVEHGERSSSRGGKGTAYLQLGEVEWLPSVIERALREQQARNSQTRLRSEIDRAARNVARNQKLATIGRLTGSIAHEINNPLEAVTNLLYLLGRSDLSSSAREYLELAQKELDRVVRISKQTLNFYRESPTPIRVGLGGLLDEVLVLYSRRIAQKQIEVVSRFTGDDELLVFPGELRQVFSNLISNAIEASAERGRLYLRLRKSRFWGDPEVTGIRVTIADQGVGMPADVRRRVGEAFFTTKGERGTGLGLWVTLSIVRNYGGSLLLRSSTGKHHGTVFTLFLPTNLRPQVVVRTPETMNPEADSAGDKGEDSGEQIAGERCSLYASGPRPLAS